MTLNLDKSSWKRVAFGDVIESATDRVNDPSEAGVDRYVGLQHLDPGVMTVQRWDTPDKVEAQKLRFQPGDVIFGRRRAYQKKVALAEFEGICSAHALVLRARSDYVDPGFLPVFLSSDYFLDRAIEISVGSLSPTVNWRDLKVQEFDFPPLDEQKHIAHLLWAVENHRRQLDTCERVLFLARRTWLHSLFESARADTGFIDLDSLVDSDRPICYGVLMPGPEYDDGPLIVDVKDYPEGRIRVDSVRRCDPAIESGFKRSRLRAGDVLLSIRGTIGRVAVVPEALDGQNISRDSARISGDRDKVEPEFLRLVLESPDVQEEIRRTTTGLAVKGINVARIRSLEVPDWPLKRQRASTAAHAEIEGAIEEVRAEKQKLSAVRSSVLAEIFGGD